MTFEKPREFVGEHKVVTAAAAAAAAAATAVAVGGYAAYRKRKFAYELELDENHAPQYEEHLAVFETEQLPLETRRAMARLAAHIFHANKAGEDFVTGQSLRDHFAEMHQELLTRHQLNNIAGHLKQHKLIGRVRGTGDNSRSHGYAALPALEWALMYSDTSHPLLAEAIDEQTAEFSDN